MGTDFKIIVFLLPHSPDIFVSMVIITYEMKKTMDVTILTDDQRAAFKDACSSVYDWYRSEYPQYDLDAIMADIANY